MKSRKMILEFRSCCNAIQTIIMCSGQRKEFLCLGQSQGPWRWWFWLWVSLHPPLGGRDTGLVLLCSLDLELPCSWERWQQPRLAGTVAVDPPVQASPRCLYLVGRVNPEIKSVSRRVAGSRGSQTGGYAQHSALNRRKPSAEPA